MAEVAARSIFDGFVVRWENGRDDTAGDRSDDPIRPLLRRAPEIACRLAEVSKSPTPADASGYRYWTLTTKQQDNEASAIDAKLYRFDGKHEPVDLHEKYDEFGRNLRLLVEFVDVASSNS
jgi:hypothetical protein